MKNIGKKTSSFVCCLLYFLMTAAGQERGVNYYLLSIKDEPHKHIFVAFKYAMENNGRTRVEEYKYLTQNDTISLTRIYFYRESRRSLIRYFYRDTVGQTYLKFQLDTSFVFKYMDPVLSDSSVSCYLGKEILLRDGNKKELHKFRVDKDGVVSYVYLHEDFLLERMEWTIEKYSHRVLERVDTSQVPKGFREKVENYKSEMDTEGEEDEEVKTFESGLEKGYWTSSSFVVVSAVSLLFFICVFYLVKNK